MPEVKATDMDEAGQWYRDSITEMAQAVGCSMDEAARIIARLAASQWFLARSPEE